MDSLTGLAAILFLSFKTPPGCDSVKRININAEVGENNRRE
jgi:hypothetical protein